MSSLWEVHVIEFARSKDQPLIDLVNGAPTTRVLDLPFGFVLARNGSRIVLIDTGFLNEGSGADFSEKFGIPYWISPLRMLEELGVAADDVTDIVLSHAHFDHMGSISAFTKARIFIQKKEWLSWNEAMALPPQYGFLTAIINPDNMRSAFDAAVEHRLTLVDGDKDNLLPGLHVRLGEGHTLGQQFVILETAKGRLVAAGAKTATHLFNAMSPLENRTPGLVGAAINLGSLYAGIIADGFHVHPASMSIALRAKRGPGRIFIISDAMSTIGTDLTGFTLNGRQIFRKDGRLTLADGTLAGADIDMLSSVLFVHRTIGLDFEEAVRMASLYPAEAIGVADRKGQLRAGYDADFVVLSTDYRMNSTWIGGERVFEA
jgi:glyoxylase-like metal-dependent hydrolase (beta-lactamase superfamily II)